MKQFISRAYGATKLLLAANGPSIMVGGGVLAMGVGTVLACKQTLKIEEVLEDHVPMLEKIQTGADLGLNNYSDDDARGDRLRVYSRIAWDMGKLYAVPSVFFGGGVALVFGGHRIMIKRNASLALAFTTVSKALASYRARVTETLGSDVDQGMMSGYKTQDVWDDELGKAVSVNTRDWADSPNGDPYNRVFEQGATSQWENDLSINRMFVSHQMRFAQQRLNQQGYLYLNDVYQALGFEPNDIGQIVGWKVTRNADGSRNIPFVDFGLDKPHPDDWKYSNANSIYLDFNCQGLIVGGRVQKLLEKV